MADNVTCWVSTDGSYGQDDIVVFHPESLTDDQWEFMTILRDSERFDYVQAILEGDLTTVAEFYAAYEDNN